MTQQELLAHFYQAYKSNDEEYAVILQAKFPVECQELLAIIEQADTEDKFRSLMTAVTK